jgi:hypothetical protein
MIAVRAISFAGFLAFAPLAHAGTIAVCAYDRYLDVMASPKTNTLARILEASDLAAAFCLGEHPTIEDHAEFQAGVDRAVHEILQALKKREKL